MRHNRWIGLALLGAAGTLRKPFRASELLAAVGRALGGPA